MSYELFNSQADAVGLQPVIQGETEEEYHVEVIIKARYKLGEADDFTHTGSKKIPGKWEYWVKWAGYPDEQNTWQSEESLVENCARLIKEFWDEFNFDELRTEDIMDGIVEASKEWINHQKKYFYNHYGEFTLEIVDDTPMDEEITNPQDEPGSSSEEEDDDDDEEEGRDVDNADEDEDREGMEHDDVDKDGELLAQTRQQMAMWIPPTEACNVTPELLDEQEFYFQNVYPSPMSIDDGDA